MSHYAECRVFLVMLSTIMLSVNMLSVITQVVIILSIMILSIFQFKKLEQCIKMCRNAVSFVFIVMESVFMLNITILEGIMLSVIMLNECISIQKVGTM